MIGLTAVPYITQGRDLQYSSQPFVLFRNMCHFELRRSLHLAKKMHWAPFSVGCLHHVVVREFPFTWKQKNSGNWPRWERAFFNESLELCVLSKLPGGTGEKANFGDFFKHFLLFCLYTPSIFRPHTEPGIKLSTEYSFFF